MKLRSFAAVGLAIAGLVHIPVARADMVTDWSANLDKTIVDAAQFASHTSNISSVAEALSTTAQGTSSTAKERPAIVAGLLNEIQNYRLKAEQVGQWSDVAGASVMG